MLYPSRSSTLLCTAVIGISQTNALYNIPQTSNNILARAAAIGVTQAGFQYGPPVTGGPCYPSGPLGIIKAAADVAVLTAETAPAVVLLTSDLVKASVNEALGKFGDLKTLGDYVSLYDEEWRNILPKGPVPGILTNYTQDLLFSMERLANSPFAIRRLDPASDSLPFDVPDATIKSITISASLQDLLSNGSLFFANYTAQASLPRNAGTYAGSCDAYFFIDSATGEFLPLAIRTDPTQNLVYTREDSANDWLLAKIVFNVNDFYFAQLYHLAATHEVVQIAWMAAIRTISVAHPVYALLDRLTLALFAFQPAAASILFAEGGAFGAESPFSGTTAAETTTDLYFNHGAGAFQANYFEANLKNRGLINSATGPNLTHFPFYEDASVIHSAIRTFMTSFVESYYAADDIVKADSELQAWATEANTAARALDFPSKITSTETLIDIMTHVAHLVSSAHHVVNTNELVTISGTLPLHPGALYKPIPTTKGSVTNVADWLPKYDKVVAQFNLEGLFARPLLVNTSRTLMHMFDDPATLALMNNKTSAAAADFKATMASFSDVVSARTFDDQGLSQGMPFVWRALDPRVALYSLTV